MLANPVSFYQPFIEVPKPEIPEGIESEFAKIETKYADAESFPLELDRIRTKNERVKQTTIIKKYSVPELKSIAIEYFGKKFDVKTGKEEIVAYLKMPEHWEEIERYPRRIPRHVKKVTPPSSKTSSTTTSRESTPVPNTKSPTGRGRGRPKIKTGVSL